MLRRKASRAESADPAEQNIRAVARLERQARETRSPGASVSDAITRVAGNEWSLSFHVVFFAAWLTVNGGWTPLPKFDPFPFSLLTSIVSLEAIFLSLFVLASQNRLTREADKRAHLDLQVNLLAEQEMTVVLRMLKELCDRFDLKDTTHSEQFEALLKRTDVKSLADRLDATLGPARDAGPAHARHRRVISSADADDEAAT